MNIIVYSSRSVDQAAFTKYKPVQSKLIFDSAAISANSVRSLVDKNITAVCVDKGDVVDKHIIDLLEDIGIKSIIARCSTLNNIDLNYAKELGVKVYRCPYGSPYAVAELAVSMILTLNRKLHISNARTSKGDFSIDGLQGFDLNGKVVGILGDNKVSNIVANIFHAFRANIIIYSKELSDTRSPRYEYSTNMDLVLQKCDVLSIHLPQIPENRHIIDKRKFRMMKNHVIIANVCRTPAIKTNSLVNALLANEIGGIGIEVSPEDDNTWVNEDGTGNKDQIYNTLKMMKNVIITPCMSNLTEEGVERRTKVTFASLLSAHGGTKCKYEVTI